jgi:hypothetical protein
MGVLGHPQEKSITLRYSGIPGSSRNGEWGCDIAPIFNGCLIGSVCRQESIPRVALGWGVDGGRLDLRKYALEALIFLS